MLRRNIQIGSREIGMLAACGLISVEVVRRPRVAVLSTGDELIQPGEPLRTARVYDSNGAIIAAAIAEAGGEAVPFGAIADDQLAIEAKPSGCANQPRSHNAVAAAIAQHSADWGVAIAPEHYDFRAVEGRRQRPAVQAFIEVLQDEAVRNHIRALGMEPAAQESI